MSPGREPGKAGSVAMAGGGTEGVGGVGGMGGLAHAASRALAIISGRCRDFIACAANLFTSPGLFMTLLLLEALGALLLLVFIVWWTMFSGRKKGELRDETERSSDRDGDLK